MNKQPPRLRRPHAIYTVALKTPLARKLFHLTVGMANALTKLGLAVQHRLPPEEGRQAAALALEILAALQNALAQEKAAVADQNVPSVTVFPVVLKKELQVCHANAVKTINLLVALDDLARTWHDLFFIGKLSQEEFNAKGEDWKRRFRRASQQINNLRQRYLGGQDEEESQGCRTGQTPFPYLHANR